MWWPEHDTRTLAQSSMADDDHIVIDAMFSIDKLNVIGEIDRAP